MSKLTIALFGIALLLLFSPTFVYLMIVKVGPSMPSTQVQIVSVLPFILGIILLGVLKIMKREK
jgi:hypothetical protein